MSSSGRGSSGDGASAAITAKKFPAIVIPANAGIQLLPLRVENF
jgi:hypothetical protein